MPPFNYILFDAARAERNLYRAMELNHDHKSLYKGWAEEDLAGVAPYLFSVRQQDSDFVKWFMHEGWGRSWGTALFANAAFDDVYRHFRQFLMVKTEDKQQLYFRFYDPRVLRIFLPTCDQQQLREFFGPVRHFIAETDEPGMGTQFWLENYVLHNKVVSMADDGMAGGAPEKVVQEEKPHKTEMNAAEELETDTAVIRRKRKFNFDVE